MSLAICGFITLQLSFPRVSGDEPSASDPFVLRTRFSPRERG